MQLTPVGREAGALRPVWPAKASPQSREEVGVVVELFRKDFALSASAVCDGALVQLSTLASCVLTACLAVNRVRVSTCAERGGEREEGPLKNRV